MESCNIITIQVKIDDESRYISVKKGDNIYNSIKENLRDKFPHNTPLNIYFGGDVVDDESHNTFESFGIEENSTFSVKPNVDFLASRWKNCSISFEEYIDKIQLVGWKYQILTQLFDALNEPNHPFFTPRELNQKILELIARLTELELVNATLCDIQMKLLEYDIILPSDELIRLGKDLDDLYSNEDPDDPENETRIQELKVKIRKLKREDLERLG